MNRAIEQAVRRRAQGRCEYCHRPQWPANLKFTIDHIRSRQHGGTNDLENLAVACGHRNSHKGPNIAAIDPLTGRLTRLFHPRIDHWNKHFRFKAPRIIGLTPIGRATVAILNFNGPSQLVIRAALFEEGVFPLR
jgi:HNH endonuclease